MTAQSISIIFLFFFIFWLVKKDRKREEQIASLWRHVALMHSVDMRRICVYLERCNDYDDHVSAIKTVDRLNKAMRMATRNARWIDGGNRVDTVGDFVCDRMDQLVDAWLSRLERMKADA